MSQISVPKARVLTTIRALRELLAKLEKDLAISEGAAPADPYRRRRELLEKIFWMGNSVRREELFPMLEASGTNSRWIGQQVKRGYLALIPAPDGSARYAVTPRAVRELALAKSASQETLSLTKLAEPSFAEDWDSPEDSIYDNL